MAESFIHKNLADIQDRRTDVADIAAFEEWSVPCLVACLALIDKPGIKFFAVALSLILPFRKCDAQQRSA
jgi:hypothetical protein